MGIQRLPSAVVSSLRTDVTVTTTAQCVTELVLNSIDASACAIAVRVDLQNFRIQVVDNGCGLSCSDLNVIGTRYMTSKCHSIQDLQSNLSQFGFRGEALSSISEVCGTMTIASRCQGSEETYCKVFTRGMPHNAGKSRQQRASSGTTITVADFLFNRPVRRARIKPALDLENIKSHMESIALINPHISFSLRNDVNNETILQTQRAENIPAAFRSLFGSCNATNLVAVKECKGPFEVKGFISNEAHSLKNLQFIYVNKRLLLKTKLHKLVNSLMSRSAILKSNNVPFVPISKDISHGVFLAFSPPKRDKHAIFVLNITCPLSEYDITLDPKKTLVEFCNWDCLLSCFESLLRKFIERESGLHSEKNQTFGSEPPRKVQSVVDEINQLTRENALGADVSVTSEESICTKDLSRAVHSLPASRRQVVLSPVLSLEGVPSTTSSNIFSSAVGRDGTITSVPSSVLTEKPYPPMVQSDPLKCDSEVGTSKQDTCWTETESLSLPPTFLKCPVKSSEKNSFIGKRPVKGFIADTIHFQENFRKIPDAPTVNNAVCHKETALNSPVNALASIKEIRRKKLLSNLNKFSFNTACEKPVLYKRQLPKPQVGAYFTKVESNAGHYMLPIDEASDIFGEQSQKSIVRNSKAVQTSFTPVTLDCTDDIEPMCSQIATVQSTAAALSICSENQNDSFVCDNVQCIKSDIVNVSSNDTYKGGENEEYQRIISVEDLIVTAYGIRQKEGALLTSCDTPNFKQTALTEASEELIKSPKSETKNVWDSHSGSKNVKTSDQLCVKIYNEDFTEATRVSSIEKPISFCEPFSTDHCEKLSLPVSEVTEGVFYGGTFYEHQSVNVKIVDYDSSPTSSQETFQRLENSFESDTISPHKLKRKQAIHHGNTIKKLCSPHESSSSIQAFSISEDLKETSISCQISGNSSKQDIDLDLIEDEHTNSYVESDLVRPSEGQLVQTEKERNSLKIGMDKVSSDSGRSNDSGHPIEIKNHQTINVETATSNHCTSSNYLENLEDGEVFWVEQLDHSGKPFYVHKTSGMTTYQKPNEEKCGAFKFGDRFAFLPKGMSPILYNKCTKEPSSSPSITHFRVEEDLSSVKWDMEQTEKKTDFWPLVDQLLSESDKFSLNRYAESQVSNATLQELPQVDIGVYNVIFPCSFSKDIFSKLRVLGQLDNKFIITIVSLDSNKDLVVLFDQHAVHERIRVENLTDEYKQHDGTATWKSAPVDPALPLPLRPIEVRILESYMQKMEHLGFHFSVIDSTTISVQRVPTCLLLRENREVTGRGVSVLRQHLESLIREQVESLLDTRGVGTDHPTIIQNVISSEACRGAVKFGHKLTVAECQAFLHNLSQCNLPFQCAHGRPALVPLVDISMLKQKPQLMKPNLKKLCN